MDGGFTGGFGGADAASAGRLALRRLVSGRPRRGSTSWTSLLANALRSASNCLLSSFERLGLKTKLDIPS